MLIKERLRTFADTEAREFFASLAIVCVHGAYETRIERTGNVTHFYGVLWVGDMCTDEGFLHRTVDLAIVTRANVPGGGSHDLVILNAAVLENNPVGERTARGLGRSEPFAFGQFDGFGVVLVVEFQIIECFASYFVVLGGFMHASHDPDEDAGTHGTDGIEEERIEILVGSGVRFASDDLARERTRFEGEKALFRHVVTRRFGPTVFPLFLTIDGIDRFRNTVPRMELGGAAVEGVGDVFFYAKMVKIVIARAIINT